MFQLQYLILPLTFLALVVAPSAQAIPLPSIGASADATAMTPGDTGGTVSNSGPVSATATESASGSGSADAFAQATVGGALRSSSDVSSASGLALSSNASSTARWVGHFQTTGIDPGNPIGVNMTLQVDGLLDYFNNNTNVGAGDLLSSVSLRLTLHDVTAGASNVFDGSADLSGVSRTDPPVLIRSGDWADASRDGDFSIPSCSQFSCQADVDASIFVSNALLVGFGTTFAVEVELATSAFQAQGRETGAASDFSNTATVALSTASPGVVFAAVPEPGTGLLMGLGLSLLGWARRGRG
jgi:hypothetical protein